MTESKLFHFGILYVDLQLLKSYAATTAASKMLAELSPVRRLSEFSDLLGGFQAWCQKALTEANLRVRCWEKTSGPDFQNTQYGDLVAFKLAMRTKGIGHSSTNDVRHGEIYRELNGTLVRMTVDPAWVTSDHAHHMFRSRNVSLRGILSTPALSALKSKKSNRLEKFEDLLPPKDQLESLLRPTNAEARAEILERLLALNGAELVKAMETAKGNAVNPDTKTADQRSAEGAADAASDLLKRIAENPEMNELARQAGLIP